MVSVLQTSGVWLLLAIGCHDGQCLLVRHSVAAAADTPEMRVLDVNKFVSDQFLPINTVAVATRHVGAGTGESMGIVSFAWVPNSLLAVGYAAGPVLVFRVHCGGHVLTKHDIVKGDSPAQMLQFVSETRLVVVRNDELTVQAVEIGETNGLVRAVPTSSHRLAHQIVWLGCSPVIAGAGAAAFATHDTLNGGVALFVEQRPDGPLTGPLPVMASGAPQLVAAAHVSISPELSATVRLADEDGSVIMTAETVGPSVAMLRDMLAAGRETLEPPHARAFWKRGAEAGLVALAPLPQATDDEAAETMMQVCVERDCLGVLEGALRGGTASARATHLREWSKQFAARVIERGEKVLRRGELQAMEEQLALFGSLYRLQESLAFFSQGSEPLRVEAETFASRTLAHAQRLEVAIWMVNSDLLQLVETRRDFFPVSVIEATSRARRKALGDEFLFADYLWHHMNAGASTEPDGKLLWPPVSFVHILDAMASNLVAGPVRHAVLLYGLLDAAALGSERDAVERSTERLGASLGFSQQLERRVRAFWMIDRNLDTSKAASELAEVGFGEFSDAMGMLAVRRLRMASNAAASLTLMRSLPDPTTPDGIQTAVATYLACGDIHEALLLTRRVEKASDGAAFLLFLARCDREEGQLQRLIRLPLLREEENALFSFVGALAVESGRECRDVLVLYLLLRGRVIEATQLWGRIRSLVVVKRESVAKQLDELVGKASESIPACLSTNSSGVLMASLYQPPVFSVEPFNEEHTNNAPMDLVVSPVLGRSFSATSMMMEEESFGGAPLLSTPVRSIKKLK